MSERKIMNRIGYGRVLRPLLSFSHTDIKVYYITATAFLTILVLIMANEFFFVLYPI